MEGVEAYKICGCFKRKFKSVYKEPPGDVKDLFHRYSVNGAMDVNHLHSFLVEIQREAQVSEAGAQKAFDAVRSHSFLTVRQRQQGMNLEDFFRYLFNEDLNSCLQSKIHHDMAAPLSHYFIYTSHNSYLTGNQLSSDCSDAPILKALEKGVRVIELDIWPNSSKDDILVLHGRTLTAPVEFIKCLSSIKKHAFVASQYPVIITLEDHLTKDLQAKAAAVIIQTFGETLYYPDSETMEEFPSPEFLKGRIIISTKPPETKTSEVEENGDKQKQKTPDEEPWGDELPDYGANVTTEGKNPYTIGSNAEDSDEDEGNLQRNPDKDAPPEYKGLITIRAGKPKGASLKDAIQVDGKQVRRVSLSEPQLEKVVSSHPDHLIRFTQKNILRVYPKGTRVTSSNYNPMIALIHGAQMVALNMQGYGRPLWFVHGFFRANGGCGYVKKPDFLLPNGSETEDQNIFDPKAKRAVKTTLKGYGRPLWLVHGFFRANGGCGYVKKPDFLLPNGSETEDQNIFDPKAKRAVKTTLKIKIYMGDGWNQDFKKKHFDTCSPPDLYTRVGIAGVPADTVMKKTRAIEDHWTPCWNEEFVFPLTVPELALLRIEVHEDDMSGKDDFAGQTCFPVTELRLGIRTIPLFNKKGEIYKSARLLARIEFI